MTSLPRPACCFGSVFAANPKSSANQFRPAEGPLVSGVRMVIFAVSELRSRSSPASPPPRPHDQLYAASGFRAESRCRLAEGKARQERHAAGVPAVRLCRHRQDHAGAPYRRRRRRRSEIRGLHRQGRVGDAQQGLRQRFDHSLADLPRPRIRRRAAELRIVGRRAGVQGKTDRDRRMLDGGCRTRPRPDVVRVPAAGARRPRAIAADPGRRLLHRLRARRDADRSASPGPGRSDRADVDGRARGPRTRHRPLRRKRSGVAQPNSIRTG